MIYTITFSPAIDYVMSAEKICMGKVNRSEHEEIYFGGKGINVSAVLAQLGVKSTALGFTAGFTGEAIEKGISEMGIVSDFVRLPKGNSRINVKIRAGQETEINGQGADIDSISLEKFFRKLENITADDTAVIAGSVPKSLPDGIYEEIMRKLSAKGVRTAVDCEKNLLMGLLKYKPFVIKPNHHELGEIFGTVTETLEDIKKYALELHKMGACNVLVSMAERGAYLLDSQENSHVCGACSGELKNSVGAGDSMLAGFLAGTEKGYEYALKLGTACGGATAFSEGLGSREMIDSLMKTQIE